MASWKNLEREVAKKMGGKRHCRMGDFSESAPDVHHPLFSIECKYGHQVPKFFYDTLQQASKYSGKVPVVVAHRKRERRKIVAMYWEDFLDFFGTHTILGK